MQLLLLDEERVGEAAVVVTRREGWVCYFCIYIRPPLLLLPLQLGLTT